MSSAEKNGRARPVRLLLIIRDLSGGGAERQLSLLASHLPRDRFELHLAVWRHVFDYPAPPGVVLHHVHKSRWWHVVGAIRATRRLIAELRPDVVYSQLHYVNMVTGSALARIPRPPSWICRQSNDPRREMEFPFVLWARRALRRADWVVSCSHGVHREVIRYLRMQEARSIVLDNLVDGAAIERGARAPISIDQNRQRLCLVHCARLEPQKNQQLLLRAFARLRGRPAELLVIGAGRDETRLRRLSAELGLQKQVQWLGFQENPWSYFRAADCFVLTSNYEGLPNVLIEAMLCGLPAIATDCPFGPAELIDDGVTGRLVPPEDTTALGDVFEWALVERHRALPMMGLRAKAKAAERFDLQRGVDAYARLFEAAACATSNA